MVQTKEQLDATIEEALAQRLAGNEFFKQGDLIKALTEYHGVLLKLKGAQQRLSNHYPVVSSVDISGNPTPEAAAQQEGEVSVRDKVKNALHLTYLNQSAVLIKLGKHKRALECALEALKYDEKSTKAKFREAQARIGTGEVQKGKKILLELQKEKPDTAITAALKQIQVDEQSRKVKSDTQFKGMFSKNQPEATTRKISEITEGVKAAGLVDGTASK